MASELKAIDRLEIIASSVVLTNKPRDTDALPIRVARELMEVLLNHGDAKTEATEFIQADKGALVPPGMEIAAKENILETVRRVNAERDLAAMSLACHVYRFDTGTWPKSRGDLHGYLSRIPIDPWGDGKQTFGYALIEDGLPDRSDRPLVYSRGGVKGGLFFRKDSPVYGRDPRTQGGQFRDVAAWVPTEPVHSTPTTRPLE